MSAPPKLQQALDRLADRALSASDGAYNEQLQRDYELVEAALWDLRREKP